jgi:spectrin alpha
LQEAFVTAEEFGQDLEHVEVLQRKFDEFLKELGNQQYRIGEVNNSADRLINEGHPDVGAIRTKQEVRCTCPVYLTHTVGSERSLA